MYWFSIHSEKKVAVTITTRAYKVTALIIIKSHLLWCIVQYVYPANLKGGYRIAWYPAITVIEKWIFILSTKEVDSILLN